MDQLDCRRQETNPSLVLSLSLLAKGDPGTASPSPDISLLPVSS